jgi:cell surface protein SprA
LTQKRHTHFGYKILAFIIIVVSLAHVIIARGYDDPYFYPDPPPDDSTATSPNLHFPIEDQDNAAPVPTQHGSLDLADPANYQNEVEYNPEDSTYNFRLKVGDENIKNPAYMSAEDYLKYRGQQDETDYWRQRLDALNMFNQKPKLPELKREGLFDRLFGGNKISIKPQGNLDLTFGGSWQNMKNPNLIQSQQKYGIFDFDMNMNVNLVAQIGDKLKLNISQNTLPTFGEQNTQKLEYTGHDDEIIKKIEAGNVSFPLKSSLLSGPLSLFGIKTQLQFGKLFVTGVMSNQKSQRKTINVQGGAQTQDFEIKADDYEENRNFFLGQYFHDNYEPALANLPIINAQVNLTRVEVWITNRTGATQGVRDILSFMDLGEKKPYVPTFTDPGSLALPDNRANHLYDLLSQNPGTRLQSTATQTALGMGLRDGQDFQRSTMRQLSPTEFTFQSQLGFISLNTQVNPDDILAVAYRYTYNGKTYQVGEFAEDFPPDSTNQQVIFLKLLKGTAIRPGLPIWKLMMKNIYSIGSYGNLSAEDFKLNVMYEDPSGGEKRYLPDGPRAGVPLITLLNLDRLNRQNDPSPDGVFDYVDGITVNPQQGKIIFPVLEPFGSALKPAMGGNPQLEKRYLFQMLYDSTKSIARQFQQNNRFLIKGSYKGAGGSEISLGGYNIPEGSVSVTAGGQRLAEGVDYSIDYSRGAVTILNQGILNSGIPISISYEDNATFGFVNQSFWGARFDYFANDHLTIGSTVMRLTERPYSEKVQVGDDPIKNTVIGLDANYQNEFPALTRALDKLPFFSTTAPSLLSLNGEVAGIFPGHQKFINVTDPDGSVSIDDFEGSTSSIDLRFPATSWSLASTPVDASNGQNADLFPEAKSSDISNGKNRAKLAWYMIDPYLVDGNAGTPANIKADTALQDYWRLVQQKEVFNRDQGAYETTLSTFDLGFYPGVRGPYNFDANPSRVDANGRFLPATHKERWGGIQRAIDNNSSDFEASNVEYITFWVLDPFIYNGNNEGDLYINLGNVSEDVLKDSRLSFENGIPYPKDLSKLDLTDWGYVPRFQQQITRSFDNDPNARAVQDVGFDELDDNEENQIYKNYLTAMQGILTPAAFQKLLEDPAADNFHYFQGEDYDQEKRNALTRYLDFNNPQGNSPVSDLNSQYTSSGTSVPESEDINRDNTLSETEAYYQYRIHLTPNMQVGEQFLASKTVPNVKLPSGRYQEETWYQFKIPIRKYDKAIGGISDFRSIRFVRMYMAGFEDSVILRFAQLQLDRNSWRQYLFSLTSPGENIPEEDLENTSFSVTAVSLEENSSREPINYRIPPGVNQQLAPGRTGENLQQDEQSMSLQVCGLKDGDARAAFKQQSIDMRQYKHMKMFIHAESVRGQQRLKDGDLVAFIRVGSDFTNNYYEYQIPLRISPDGNADPRQIWPEANEMDVYFDKFVAAKMERNNQNLPTYLPYKTVDEKGNAIIVVGNPNFGDVKNVMLGVSNPKKTLNDPTDDGLAKCAEVWFDELRMAGLDEKPAYAASGQANIQLADLGSVHVGASMHTAGYGNIDQKVAERAQDNFYTYDANTNLNLGKLLPRKIGLQLPVFAGYSQVVSNPKYNPYDKDVLLGDQLKSNMNPQQRDSLRKAAQDFSSVTSFNVSNARYLGNPEKQGKINMPWSLKNFDASYSYNKAYKHDPTLEYDAMTDQRLNLGYSYTLKGKSIEPFKRSIKSKSKWLSLAKDFNFNLLPSNFTFRNDLHRLLGETQVRNIDAGPYQLPATFYKNFTWDRTYSLNWELTRSLSFNYTANNQSRIDEPEGRIDNQTKRDSIWSNLSRFGRNTYFSQNLTATYSLPTKKIPVLDWTTLTAVYTSSYNWTGASRLAYDLGNIVANTQTRQLNADFNFTQLYNKSRWLRAINTQKHQTTPPRLETSKVTNKNGKPNSDNLQIAGKNAKKPPERQQPVLPPRPRKKRVQKDAVAHADTMSQSEINRAWRKLKKAERKRFHRELAVWRAKKRRILPEVSDGVRATGRLLTMLKRVNISYTDNSGTVLPGFMDSTRFFGVNDRSGNNWYDFAFGYQPDEAWLNEQAARNRITRDSIFNGQLQQTYAQNYNIQATLEPVPDFRIDINWNRQFSKNYSESFKYDNTLGDYQHFNPYSLGTFSTSFIGLKTIFSPTKKNTASELYLNFLNNREIISHRLGLINPYTNGLPDPTDPDYAKGYTRYAQDVLIPAFLAAYSGKNPQSTPLVANESDNIKSNPFKGFLPMPNWKFTYNGLAKLPAFQESMSNLTISHSYMGTLSMNSFISSFYFQDLFGVGFPSFIDSNSNNYVPFFQVPNITITENLGPLLGVDIAFRSGLNLSVKFNKSRMLSLSLIDYQVSETKTTELIVGGGHRIQGLTLPFSIFGLKNLKNDVNIRVDLGYRDDITVNSYLMDNTVLPTRGQKVITIAPSIDYIINENLQLRLFYDRRQSIPVMSTSYPITTTRAGITLRFLFAPQ